MRRMICCAVFAVLLSNEAVFAQRHIPPRPHVRFIAVHRFHPPYFFPSIAPAPFLYPGPYSTGYSVQNDFVSSPQYVFVGSDSPARPQLVFKDGTSYFVTDYWRADDQLHFVTMEEGGTKSVPHSVMFDSLDQQRTKDAAVSQGFRFVLRDKPIQEWLEQHARSGTASTRKR